MFQPGDIPENIRFQSNLGQPGMTEDPRGPGGLFIFTTGGPHGVANTCVLSGTFVDSHDVITQGADNHTAMGMNVVKLLGGGTTVEVRVFNKANVLMGTTTVALSDEPPTAFIGVVAQETIGRVNIWDPGEGGEGLYDVPLWLGGTGPVPTVSEWGLIVMSLLVLTAGVIVFLRRRPAQA
jgi:hypothetical protein